MKARIVLTGLVVAALLAAGGCKKDGDGASGGEAAGEKGTTKAAVTETDGLKTDVGVNAAEMVIRIGALNDESGPGASIGIPYARGKRILAAQVNAGGSGLLPDGWTVELIEKDHGYNPQKAVQAYKETKDDVLFYGTSFGTPNTLPLRPLLQREGALAFPASLSSEIASHRTTVPIGPSYRIEAMRAVDWIVAQAGGAEDVKACVVHQKDDYGKDGKEGFEKQAAKYDIPIVSEQSVAPGQKDATAVVKGLQDAGCTHVMLVVLPSATGPVLGTAAQLDFAPVWIGNTPAWIDRFFDPEVIPPKVFEKFYWVTGFPYWGEDVPGMDRFVEAWKTYGGAEGKPDFYTLVSYAQGLAQLEAARRAIEAGDVTRAGFQRQLVALAKFDAGGLVQPLDFTQFPYATGKLTRVLAPKFDAKSWEVVGDWAAPAINP